MPHYQPPPDDRIDEPHVFAALDFLIAVEPDPPVASRAAYEAATASLRPQIDLAMATLRRFAQQTVPLSLEQLQREYASITSLPRYVASATVAAVVTGALNEAWDGVGPWRR